MAVRPRTIHCVTNRGHRRALRFEPLEERRLLSLSHLYTFNDGFANDWIGSNHATLLNGATITGGQLVLANEGVFSDQTTVVQHARLGANLLAAGDATVEVWFTTNAAANLARVLEIGNPVSGLNETYLALIPKDGSGNSRGDFRPANSMAYAVSGPALDDGLEHVAAIVIDTVANLLRFYIDGNEVGSQVITAANAGGIDDTLAYLGRSLFDSIPGFTGSINEVRIYDDVRSATDLAADAAAGPSTATKSPLVRQMEYLDRGMVSVRRATNEAYIGWRLLGTDPAGIAFNLYRSASGGAPVKLNASPLATTTDFVDSTANLTVANTYFVRAVVGGIEQDPSALFTLAANSPVQIYLNVPLQIPPGGTTPSGENYTYSANDTSVGDLDGDGQYEFIVKWEPSNAKDNSQSGYTGNVYIDAYKLDGTRLWRIDLGRNIRAGAHYTQFMVYDLDGDGRAEVAMKTAPGTIDGKGEFVLLNADNPNADYRNSGGYILSGPEYLTVFDGLTGKELSTVPYVVPRHPSTQNPTGSQLNEIWGDNYGNRVDRFLAGVAYLDGVRPSLVMARGYYTRSTIAAWDFRDGQLTQRWLFDTSGGGRGGLTAYMGQGTHSLSIADVDNDGKDEVIYGASVIDDTGVGLHSTGLGHGDALHVSDMDPNRPGLEVFMPHEGTAGNGHVGASLRDARTGALIAALPVVQNTNGSWPDVGRGVAMDIDPNHAGYEFWDSYHGSIYNSQGVAIYNKPSNMHTNFAVWWDADLLRETLDGTTISDWNYTTRGRSNYDLNPAQGGTQTAPNASSNNGSKSNPALSADLFGDWREEVIWRRSDNTALEIFTTTIAATNRLYTLMHDSQYREAIAWQNVAYNQPPHPSFFLGAGMTPPPTPQIYTVQFVPPPPGDYNGDRTVDAADYAVWRNAFGSSNDLTADGDGDLVIGPGDYAVWKQNFGATSESPILNFAQGGSGASTLVAELGTTVGAASAESLSSFALISSVDSHSVSARSSFINVPRPVSSTEREAAATHADLLFALWDAEPITSPAANGDPLTEPPDSANSDNEVWAEFDRVLPSLGATLI